MPPVLTAAGFRHGIVFPPRRLPPTSAEPPGIVIAGVPEQPSAGWRSAAGGIGRGPEPADEAAVGEALERYAAHVCEVPRRRRDGLDGFEVLELEEFSLYSEEQRRRRDFPNAAVYQRERGYAQVFRLADNSEARVPAPLIGLSPEGAGVATSSGLAAGPAPQEALLRAVQELVERDALMITWHHGVPGRRVELPQRHAAEVEALHGEAVCIDATPAYSPHAVAIVCGGLPRRGRRRYSLGAACRGSWSAAVEKAYLEWLQGATFVGYYRDSLPLLRFRSPEDVRTFDDHAVYYSVCPDEWPRLPLLQGELGPEPAERPSDLAELAEALQASGIRVFYRDLTTCDVAAAGVSVVRALSPDLAPIHCDERWPFLGGTVADVERRYPWADPARLCFVNRHRHPLG